MRSTPGNDGFVAAPPVVGNGDARQPHRAAGFTLVEVLIAIFVTGVGLLTVAGLQAISKKVAYDAMQRTTATALAQSIIQQMRANPAQVAAYVTSDATTLTQATDCGASDCTPAQVAAYDLRGWGQRLLGAEVTDDSGAASGGLVAPTGCISVDAATGLYVVTIAWRGNTSQPPPDSSTPADDPSRSSCGSSKAAYDDPDSSGSDYRMRRVLTIRAFITDPYAL